MGLFNRSFFKFTFGFIVIIAIAMVVLFYIVGSKMEYNYGELQMQQAQQLE